MQNPLHFACATLSGENPVKFVFGNFSLQLGRAGARQRAVKLLNIETLALTHLLCCCAKIVNLFFGKQYVSSFRVLRLIYFIVQITLI